MNRLIPAAMPMAAMPEPAPMMSQSAPVPSYAPGQKPHLQAMARELGVPVRGTKTEIWQRIAAKQGENVARRVRAPKAAAEAPAATETAPAIDPFEEALGRFQSFLGAR